MPMLETNRLSVRYGTKTIVDSLSFSVSEGQWLMIVGPNGAGKSTALSAITQGAPYTGSVLFEGQDVKKMKSARRAQAIGVLSQNHFVGYGFTVEEVVRLGRFAYSGGLLGRSQTEDAKHVEHALTLTGMQDKRQQSVLTLSGGELQRTFLAQVLAQDPKLLLLDEPTNHLDAESVEWLEQFLHRFPGTVVAVTHDRYFLDNAAEWILELDRGEGIPWKGNYSSWLDQKEKRLEIEKRQEDARMKAIKHELEWVRQNPKGRQAKSKARIARFEELSSVEYQQRNETNEIFIPVAERLGNDVIEFNHVSKGFGDRLLIDDLSFRIPAGAIVGVIGPNGAGKSTLFKMITGREQPDSGEIKIGTTVKLAAVDQMRDSLPNDKTAFDAVADGQDILQVGKFSMSSRAYLGRFNFKGGDQQKLVGSLSGGERGRLHLAKTLLAGGNVLLLDEPSNDLDVETLRALEEALLEFAGCALVTSHDRWFLDRIATHILAFEGDSRVVFFDGNYNEYEADKRRRLGEEACQPKRLRFKPLKH